MDWVFYLERMVAIANVTRFATQQQLQEQWRELEEQLPPEQQRLLQEAALLQDQQLLTAEQVQQRMLFHQLQEYIIIQRQIETLRRFHNENEAAGSPPAADPVERQVQRMDTQETRSGPVPLMPPNRTMVDARPPPDTEHESEVTPVVHRRKRVTRRRHRRCGQHTAKQRCFSPPNSDEEPPMSTPDDPVIHSPPSIGVSQPPGMNGYANSVSATPIKMEDSMGGHCTSPDDSNGDTASEENRRRQKTCRVCGDHATGYNFNVITCESCKAFFRRNALRPKEFKCPYSEDCEINSVSRRFCQKCRLRKCFQVGMKKEWILNEEQLRRRKNSRLNNVSSTKRSGLTHPAGGVYQQSPRPLSIAPIDNQANIDYDFEQKNYKMAQMSLNNAPVPTSLVSPPGVPKYGMSSPVGSTASDSPPSHSLSMMHTNGDTSPDAYDPNMMMTSRMPMHQQQRNMQASLPHAKVDSNGKVTLSAEEYKQLLSRIPGAQPQAVSEDEPILKKSAYSQLDSNNHHVMPMNNGTPSYPTQVPNEMQPSHNNSDAAVPPMSNQYFDISSFGMGMATAFGGSDSAEEFGRRINLFCDTIIQQAIDSPDNAGPPPSSEGACILPKPELYDTYFPPEQRSNYQLNAAELRALDIVKDAFADIDDQLEQGPSLNAFLKVHKMPVDILHIIDVGMRRFVKVSKRIPAFHDLTQEGKLSLLKGGMIELLTLRGVTRYDVATNSFHTPTVKGVKVSVNVDEMFAKLSANAQSQKEKCLRFFRFFDDEVKRNDLAVYLVMCAVLFTIRRDPPMCENDCRIVTIQHDHFMCLLSRYLTSLYGDSARRLFERIPIALSMLNDISSNAGMLFMGTMRPDEAADLPKEFFKIE